MAMLERAIAEGIAARLGADLETDPYPGVLAAAAVSVVRACLSFWTGTSGALQLRELIDQAFQALADGFPEDCALRSPPHQPASAQAFSPHDRKDHST